MLLAFAFTYLGMMALCLAMPRHAKQIQGAEPTLRRRRALRLGAVVCLALALGVNLQLLGLEMGIVLWLCLSMAAGLLLVALLAWWRRWIMPMAWSLLLGGSLGWLW